MTKHLALACLIAASLHAAPGLQMRGERLLRAPGAAGVAAGWHDADTAEGLRTVVLTEIHLWRRATQAPVEAEAAKIRDWNQVSDLKRTSLLAPNLTLLLWLEARWEERHTTRISRLNLSAFRAWEDWTRIQILRLQSEVIEQQARHKAFLVEWEAKPADARQRNQVAERNNAEMMVAWARQKTERMRHDQEEALANDKLGPFKALIQGTQEKTQAFDRRITESQ